MWRGHGRTRSRINLVVDSELLDKARKYCGLKRDEEVIDAALKAFVVQRRNAEIDEAYVAAYDTHPFDEPDEWGNLISFGQAAEKS